MIDLKAAYEQIAEILTKHGVPIAGTHYSISVEVTHPSAEGLAGPIVAFTAAAQPNSVCVMAWNRPSLEDALAGLDIELRRHLAQIAAGATPVLNADLTVTLP